MLSYNGSYLRELMLPSLAKTEEEYSNLRDLAVRVDAPLREVKRLCSQHCAVSMSASHGICALPDSLITQILLNLPTKDSVKTSVLSKRWRFLWLSVPGLELYSNDFPSDHRDINNFIVRFLEFNRESRLQKFKIKYDERLVFCYVISNWIAAMINRGAQHLDVDTLTCPFFKEYMPLDIYKSKTLVSLKLVNVAMWDPEFGVSLPCLKTMHLEGIKYSKEDPLIMEKLISGCLVLEDLTVKWNLGDNVHILRVRSQSLKRFCVRSGPKRVLGDKEYVVEIDAPALKYMNFKGNHSDRVVAKNLSSLLKIDIDTKFNVQLGNPLVVKKGTIRGFLNGISNVKHMIISQPTLEVVYGCFKLGSISKFHNLSRLEASFCTRLLQVLPNFLAGFPNLKHLTLYLVYLKELEPENIQLISVPRCLRSTLETVEIREVEETGKKKMRDMKILENKKKIWMKAVRYILGNSQVLKKLIVCFSPITNEVFNIFKELRTITKISRRCVILYQFT